MRYSDFALTDEERVKRFQLNIKHYWCERKKPNLNIEEENIENLEKEEKENNYKNKGIENWKLLNNINLHDWQIECINKWFESNKKGIVKVVTGAGKTIMALGLIEKLQNEYDKDLRVIIVVPTIVLMNQWYTTILKNSNLSNKDIGRLGGDFKDDLKNKKILISVINSASVKLEAIVNKEISKHLLLVVDECHRAGAEKMRNIFNIERAYNLGLSATPERNDYIFYDDINEDEQDGARIEEKVDILTSQLGPIIYELNFEEAINRNILPKFEIRHYGLDLNQDERSKYDKLSNEIKKLRDQLKESSKKASSLEGDKFIQWVRKIANYSNSRLSPMAKEFEYLMSKRKFLLYRADARKKALMEIIKEAIEENSDVKIIIFHETIDEVMFIFNELQKLNYKAVVEHSELPDYLRSESIQLFRDGFANIMVSAKSLIEGFDVPAADVGIIVASSTSVRQRIQTLGRILRKHKSIEGKEKEAVLNVLYIRNTTDEAIYQKINWDSIVGAQRNLYFYWNMNGESKRIKQEGPPKLPKLKDTDIDIDKLEIGDEYLGEYEGEEYKCDSQGNVINKNGEYILNPQNIPKLIYEHLGYNGSFKITPNKRIILIRKEIDGIRKTIYLGVLSEPFKKERIHNISKKSDKYIIKQIQGKLRIAKKIKKGELFALFTDNATDKEKGQDAENVISIIEKLGRNIKEIFVNEHNEVFTIIDGEEKKLYNLKKGFEFKN